MAQMNNSLELRSLFERFLAAAVVAGSAIFLFSAALDLAGGLNTDKQQLQFALHSLFFIAFIIIYLCASHERYSRDAGNTLQGLTGLIVAGIHMVDLELHPNAFELGTSGTVAFAISCLILDRKWVYISLALIAIHQLSIIYRFYEPSEWGEFASFSMGVIVLCLIANWFRDIGISRISALRERSEASRVQAEANLKALQEEIEERQRLTAEMLRLEKSEGLQRLAGGIAHDLNNLLVPIMGNAELLQLKPGHIPEQRAERILSAAQQASNLVQQLVHYSGKGTSEPTAINLCEELETLKSLTTSSFDLNIDLQFDIPIDSVQVTADKSRLQQVLLNLVINATEAFEPGPGKVQVSTGAAQLTLDEAALLLPKMIRNTTEYVRITVADNGLGIDPDGLNRIFEPFYTSKSDGRGLGLAGALEFASAHGGGFRVTSALNSGTQFDLYLPNEAIAHSPPMPARVPVPDQEPSSEQRVLIFQRDDLIRNMMTLRLHALGYGTTTVVSNDQVAGLFSADGRFAFAMVGLRVHDTNLDELIQTLRQHQADLPIILCPGDRHVMISEALLSTPDLAYITPPFTDHGLKEAIELVVGNR